MCRSSLPLINQRHHAIVRRVGVLLTKLAIPHQVEVELDRNKHDTTRLRPDIQFYVDKQLYSIDVTVPFDDKDNLDLAYNKKVEKYGKKTNILPLVVGTAGGWHPENRKLMSTIKANKSDWAKLEQDCILLAISGSLAVLDNHIGANQNVPARNSR